MQLLQLISGGSSNSNQTKKEDESKIVASQDQQPNPNSISLFGRQQFASSITSKPASNNRNQLLSQTILPSSSQQYPQMSSMLIPQTQQTLLSQPKRPFELTQQKKKSHQYPRRRTSGEVGSDVEEENEDLDSIEGVESSIMLMDEEAGNQEELNFSNEESKGAAVALHNPDSKKKIAPTGNRPSKRHIPPASLASWRSGKPTILTNSTQQAGQVTGLEDQRNRGTLSGVNIQKAVQNQQSSQMGLISNQFNPQKIMQQRQWQLNKHQNEISAEMVRSNQEKQSIKNEDIDTFKETTKGVVADFTGSGGKQKSSNFGTFQGLLNPSQNRSSHTSKHKAKSSNQNASQRQHTYFVDASELIQILKNAANLLEQIKLEMIAREESESFGDLFGTSAANQQAKEGGLMTARENTKNNNTDKKTLSRDFSAPKLVENRQSKAERREIDADVFARKWNHLLGLTVEDWDTSNVVELVQAKLSVNFSKNLFPFQEPLLRVYQSEDPSLITSVYFDHNKDQLVSIMRQMADKVDKYVKSKSKGSKQVARLGFRGQEELYSIFRSIFGEQLFGNTDISDGVTSMVNHLPRRVMACLFEAFQQFRYFPKELQQSRGQKDQSVQEKQAADMAETIQDIFKWQSASCLCTNSLQYTKKSSNSNKTQPTKTQTQSIFSMQSGPRLLSLNRQISLVSKNFPPKVLTAFLCCNLLLYCRGKSLFDRRKKEFPLHKAVFENQLPLISRLIACKSAGVLFQDKNEVDLCGNTALTLAVKLKNADIVQILTDLYCSAKLSPFTNQLSAFDHAKAMRERRLVEILMQSSQKLKQNYLYQYREAIFAILERLPDFSIDMHFECSSYLIPLVKQLAPSDTYHIHKQGSNLRLDMRIIGFKNFQKVEGNLSVLFKGRGSGSSEGELLVVDHQNKRVTSIFEEGAESKMEREMENIMSGQDVQKKYRVERVTVEREVDRRGNPVTQNIEGFQTEKFGVQSTYTLTKFKLNSQTGQDCHQFVSFQEYLHAGYLNLNDKSQIFKLDLANQKKFAFSGLLSNNELNNSGAKETGRFYDEKERQLKNDIHESDLMKKTLMTLEDLPQGSRSNRNQFNSDEKSDFCNKCNNTQKKTPNKQTNQPNQCICQTKQRKNNFFADQNESSKALGVQIDVQKVTRKTLNANIWLCEDHPLSIETFMPLLQVLSFSSKQIRKLEQSLNRYQLPHDKFPICAKVPFLMTIEASFTFQNLRFERQPDSIFKIDHHVEELRKKSLKQHYQNLHTQGSKFSVQTEIEQARYQNTLSRLYQQLAHNTESHKEYAANENGKTGEDRRPSKKDKDFGGGEESSSESKEIQRMYEQMIDEEAAESDIDLQQKQQEKEVEQSQSQRSQRQSNRNNSVQQKEENNDTEIDRPPVWRQQQIVYRQSSLEGDRDRLDKQAANFSHFMMPNQRQSGKNVQLPQKQWPIISGAGDSQNGNSYLVASQSFVLPNKLDTLSSQSPTKRLQEVVKHDYKASSSSVAQQLLQIVSQNSSLKTPKTSNDYDLCDLENPLNQSDNARLQKPNDSQKLNSHFLDYSEKMNQAKIKSTRKLTGVKTMSEINKKHEKTPPGQPSKEVSPFGAALDGDNDQKVKENYSKHAKKLAVNQHLLAKLNVAPKSFTQKGSSQNGPASFTTAASLISASRASNFETFQQDQLLKQAGLMGDSAAEMRQNRKNFVRNHFYEQNQNNKNSQRQQKPESSVPTLISQAQQGRYGIGKGEIPLNQVSQRARASRSTMEPQMKPESKVGLLASLLGPKKPQNTIKALKIADQTPGNGRGANSSTNQVRNDNNFEPILAEGGVPPQQAENITDNRLIDARPVVNESIQFHPGLACKSSSN